MKLIDLIARFGVYLEFYIGVCVWGFLLTCVTVRWQCGLCGKINETGILKHLLCMCDHQGLQ